MVRTAALAVLFAGAATAAPYHYVHGYTKKDGTYVAPHYQTNPNGTKADNWSTVGNVNPFTGKPGTKPDTAPATPLSLSALSPEPVAQPLPVPTQASASPTLFAPQTPAELNARVAEIETARAFRIDPHIANRVWLSETTGRGRFASTELRGYAVNCPDRSLRDLETHVTTYPPPGSNGDAAISARCRK